MNCLESLKKQKNSKTSKNFLTDNRQCGKMHEAVRKANRQMIMSKKQNKTEKVLDKQLST